jgi:hypothetical protein
MHILRGRADAFVSGNVSDTRQVRRHRCQLGQRTVTEVMQRQVPDFLFREASRIARRVPKRWAAIERAPNQAGAVAAPGQKSLRDFTQLDFTTLTLNEYHAGVYSDRRPQRARARIMTARSEAEEADRYRVHYGRF